MKDRSDGSQHVPCFTIKWATSCWEQQQASSLRRQVFCREQGLFTECDLDERDHYAQSLVAVTNIGGWMDRVVGTVRIHEDRPRQWAGSRLAVEPCFRRNSHIGSALIRLAVSSAHALGCDRFIAQVQKPNERLFQRLHWESLAEHHIRDRLHVLMRADLDRYPPYFHPAAGFVIRNSRYCPPAPTPSAILDRPDLVSLFHRQLENAQTLSGAPRRVAG
ncbi:MAG: MSMEG_0567/Sll0786 family nitrogen starvation N-acetyltransferase [Pseudomonadota bacterium]